MSYTPDDVFAQWVRKSASHQSAQAVLVSCKKCGTALQPKETGFDDLGHLLWFATCCGLTEYWLDTAWAAPNV